MSITTITRAEVAQHNKKENGWFIVNNGVYDVTKFYDDHPGGRDILIAHVGTDATEAFEGNKHSKGAVRKLEEIKIGELPEAERRKFIAMAEVEKHKTPQDAWFVINNRVYDVTKFADMHPGGRDLIVQRAGTDASKDFVEHGHSDNAYKMLEKFCVGALPPQERRTVLTRASQLSEDGKVVTGPVHRNEDESLLGRIQAQLKLLIVVGIFLLSGYLLLG